MSEVRIEGMEELADNLNKLHAEFAAKLLRQATGNAVTPLVKDAKLRIPVSDRAHRTYKGNLVTPGFAKRSIRKVTKIIDGSAVAMVGVKKEAFYATQFVETGAGRGPAQPWLVPALKAQRSNIEKRLKDQLKRKIDKVLK